MTFEEVWPAMKSGREIRRKTWKVVVGISIVDFPTHVECLQGKTVLMRYKGSSDVHENGIDIRDMLADDWQVV